MLSFVPLVVLVLLRWIGDGESFSVRWLLAAAAMFVYTAFVEVRMRRGATINSLLYSGHNGGKVRGVERFRLLLA